MLNNITLTKNHQRQLKIALKLFSSFIDKYDDFKYDICNTTIDKISGLNSQYNDLFDVNYIDGNIIVKFSGFIGDNRVEYVTTYVFYNNGSARKVSTMYEYWGYSTMKFMPYITTNEMVLYNTDGSKYYTHQKRKIEYNKTVSFDNLGRAKDSINDPKRSGTEIIRIYNINDNEYVKVMTNIKNKSKYCVFNKNGFSTIDQSTFLENLETFRIKQGRSLVKH